MEKQKLSGWRKLGIFLLSVWLFFMVIAIFDLVFAVINQNGPINFKFFLSIILGLFIGFGLPIIGIRSLIHPKIKKQLK